MESKKAASSKASPPKKAAAPKKPAASSKPAAKAEAIKKPKKAVAPKKVQDPGFRAYLDHSRELGTSLLLVVPLFVLYQVGVLTTGGVRNGVDFLSDVMWLLSDGQMLHYVGINGAILLGFLGLLLYLRRKGQFHPRVFPYVVAESSVYAMFLGTAVVQLMASLGMGKLLASGSGGDYGILTSVVLSLGAGVYEETVFRLIGMGGLFALGTKVFSMPRWMGAVFAVILSSLVFSGIHYVGSLGDAFTLGSFMFRFFAGVILAVIFYLRGFAVAVYTHAIYDIIVMVFR